MANTFYTSALQDFLLAGFGDLTSVTVKMHLTDTDDYTFVVGHDFEDDIAAASEVSTATITVTSASGGNLSAKHTTFTAVSGDQSEALVLWVDTVSGASADPLICFIDTFTSGMPVTPNGGDITCSWASGVVFDIS